MKKRRQELMKKIEAPVRQKKPVAQRTNVSQSAAKRERP